MTVLIEQLSKQETSPAMIHAYKEESEVRKLRKGYKLFPKGTLRNATESFLSAFVLTLFWAVLMAITFLSPTVVPNRWAAAMAITLPIFGLIAVYIEPIMSELFRSPHSPIVINKDRRATLKKTRLLAKGLGSEVIPVLTEDHVAAVQRVHTELVAVIRIKDPVTGKASTDYDRIVVLLLEDLNREHLLITIIRDRGLTDMGDIEALVRATESGTISPVQSGWL